MSASVKTDQVILRILRPANLLLGHNSEEGRANLILAGVDFMACCVMGGG
jgi:hypothetical protein